MKILVISDTHRSLQNLKIVLERVGTVDRVLHMGDVEGDEDRIRALVSCPVDIVAGNNDYLSKCPKELELDIGGYHFLLVHGHQYNVAMGLSRLAEEAKSREAQVVLFGHTHRPKLEYKGNLTLMNPGSLTYPRQQGRQPSYGIIEIDRFGELHFTLNYLERL